MTRAPWTFRARLLLVLLLLVSISLACAQDRAPANVPQSVLLFAARTDMPLMEVRGVPFGGLSLCRLLEQRTQPQPFWLTERHFRMFMRDASGAGGLEPEPCDLTSTPGTALWRDAAGTVTASVPYIAAYGLWGASTLLDAANPRLSQPILPQARVVKYGPTFVLYVFSAYATLAHQDAWKPNDAAAEAALVAKLHDSTVVWTPRNPGVQLLSPLIGDYPAPLRQ